MATTNDRNTLERPGQEFAYEVAAGASIPMGVVVMLNAGFATNGAAVVAAVVVGVSQQAVDNTAGAAGAKRIDVKSGTYLLKNSAGGDEIDRDDVGKSAYLVDNETVALTNAANTRPVAGKIRAVDDGGVWVTI